MHNLVKEATGIDFNELRNDLEAAKKAAKGILASKLEGNDLLLVDTCSSIGHILNEVRGNILHFIFEMHIQFFPQKHGNCLSSTKVLTTGLVIS